jgi:hypothetical protein
LIEHWGGRAWKIQASRNPGFASALNGVAATSSTNAWAVGQYAATPTSQARTLVEHWDGRAWNVQRTPNPGGVYSLLYGVAATSSRNAWAVGEYFNPEFDAETLVLHWDGRAWKLQPSPSPPIAKLYGIAATSSTNAWTVGVDVETVPFPLIEHWNGKAWKIQPSPSADGQLKGVAGTSAANLWAVGSANAGVFLPGGAEETHPMLEHWNGSAWTIQPAPDPGALGQLNGVAATSSSNAWAVGNTGTDRSARTLILHWDGGGWRTQPSPSNSSSGGGLLGVTATSSRNAWAVGGAGTGSSVRTLILQWRGMSWSG